MVSIHAPTKGATDGDLMRSLNKTVSIHAPTKGATEVESEWLEWYKVSIHAPTKGATYSGSESVQRMQSFNPRSHEGSDYFINQKKNFLHMFQSTLPRRERQVTRRTKKRGKTVSIHAPTKGATVTEALINNISNVSIHAPTKGATINH